MPVFYSQQIGNLKNPKTTNAALNQLSSKLDSTLWLSTDIECTDIDSREELYSTDDYSVQVGTYHNQEVIIRKYYTEKEKDVTDIDSIRRPWQERRIGPPIPSVDGHTRTGETRSTSTPTQSVHSAPNDGEILSAPFGILTVKESDALLQQFIPSWVALRQRKHVVLIDWADDSKSGGSGEFEPRYAIHLMGLGFSDVAPNAFQELGRSLTVPIVEELQAPDQGSLDDFSTVLRVIDTQYAGAPGTPQHGPFGPSPQVDPRTPSAPSRLMTIPPNYVYTQVPVGAPPPPPPLPMLPPIPAGGRLWRRGI
ncbi:hypothetical protein FRC00_003310 [Tulasnella sp. 408]|nr:hypothetical protein FRC00_003310 [Tulasnella sp. 408]